MSPLTARSSLPVYHPGRMDGYDECGRPRYLALGAAHYTWEQALPFVYDLLWTPLMERARACGETHVDVELGDPREKSSREFFMAGTLFLNGRSISFDSIEVPAKKGRAPRLLFRIRL